MKKNYLLLYAYYAKNVKIIYFGRKLKLMCYKIAFNLNKNEEKKNQHEIYTCLIHIQKPFLSF